MLKYSVLTISLIVCLNNAVAFSDKPLTLQAPSELEPMAYEKVNQPTIQKSTAVPSVPVSSIPTIVQNTSTHHFLTNPSTVTLSLDTLNQIEWSNDLSGVALQAFNAKAQVLLDNAYNSIGVIDGTFNSRMSSAIRAFQAIHNLKKYEKMNQETWDKLVSLQGNTPAFIEYTITSADTDKNLFVTHIPDSYEEKAKMSGLKYTSVVELLSEKFHLHEAFLKELNPKAKFVIGEKIIVPNIQNKLPEHISLIVVMVDIKRLYLFNRDKKMVASLPATISSTLENGTVNITKIDKKPRFTKIGETQSLPAGPNSPLGSIWIGLNKTHYEIHSSSKPSKIATDSFVTNDKSIRLTNWDIQRLTNHITPDTAIIIRTDNIERRARTIK